MPTVGVTVFAVTPLRWLFARGYPGAGGCARVLGSPGAAFQGRNRSRPGPDRGLPLLRPQASRYVVRKVRTFRPAISAVAVTVHIRAASRAASSFRDP